MRTIEKLFHFKVIPMSEITTWGTGVKKEKRKSVVFTNRDMAWE